MIGGGYYILEYIGIVAWWVFLNIRAVFLNGDKRRFYPFAELWKGRRLDLGGKQEDKRPYTMTGFLIMIVPMLIAIFIISMRSGR